MLDRHQDLRPRLTTAMGQLQEIRDGLPARAHANAWWPYRGRAEYSTSGGGPKPASPQLSAGEPSATVNYRAGGAHLQRALVAAAACHAGVRYRWDHSKVTVPDLPRDLLSPAACGRMAHVLQDQVRFLATAVDDVDATTEVLDQLAEVATQVGLAHGRFLRAAPPPSTGGRGVAHRPTKPARRR